MGRTDEEDRDAEHPEGDGEEQRGEAAAADPGRVVDCMVVTSAGRGQHLDRPVLVVGAEPRDPRGALVQLVRSAPAPSRRVARPVRRSVRRRAARRRRRRAVGPGGERGRAVGRPADAGAQLVGPVGGAGDAPVQLAGPRRPRPRAPVSRARRSERASAIRSSRSPPSCTCASTWRSGRPRCARRRRCPRPGRTRRRRGPAPAGRRGRPRPRGTARGGRRARSDAVARSALIDAAAGGLLGDGVQPPGDRLRVGLDAWAAPPAPPPGRAAPGRRGPCCRPPPGRAPVAEPGGAGLQRVEPAREVAGAGAGGAEAGGQGGRAVLSWSPPSDAVAAPVTRSPAPERAVPSPSCSFSAPTPRRAGRSGWWRGWRRRRRSSWPRPTRRPSGRWCSGRCSAGCR